MIYLSFKYSDNEPLRFKLDSNESSYCGWSHLNEKKSVCVCV